MAQAILLDILATTANITITTLKKQLQKQQKNQQLSKVTKLKINQLRKPQNMKNGVTLVGFLIKNLYGI